MNWVAAMLAMMMLGVDPPGRWSPQSSGTRARLRGVHAVNREVVWASGTGGTFLKTTDGGRSWQAGLVPGASALDFRDVHAFDARTACLLASGPGESSRIERTRDGGQTWKTVHTNRDPKGFLDAIAFWDATHGIALGDPVEGRFQILLTDDAGASWNALPASESPTALMGEGAFAASGTCLATWGDRLAWFGTGGGPTARVFRSTDRGRTWTAAKAPIRCDSPSSGVFSLAFRDADHGVAVGGDYQRADDRTRCVARTSDGGQTWRATSGESPKGYRSAVVRAPDSAELVFVTTGPNGSEISRDDGESWTPLGSGSAAGLGFHALASGDARDAIWAVGDDGKIGRLNRQ
jgi:photosystem II stability/assembly factor-like uncharacterized protein